MAPRQTTRHRLALTLVAIGVGALALLVAPIQDAHAKPPAAPPVTIAVTGLASATAGTTQTVRVTALMNGKPNSSYRGTVTFASDDPQALLPARYTFTGADKGTRTFTVELRTAGDRTLTIQDEAKPSLVATTPSVTVSPGVAASLTLDGLIDATAGTAQSVTLSAQDAFGNVATGYRGTVAFTSSDAQAVLPANTALTAADAGSRSFDMTLKTAGEAQTVTATDTALTSLTASDTASITSGSAVDLQLTTGIGGNLFEGKRVATAGQPFDITIRAVDEFGNTASGYVGDVELKASDERALLTEGDTHTATISLTADDGGTRTITGVTFFDKRIYDDDATLLAIDAVDHSMASQVQLQVLPGPAVSYAQCPQPVSRDSGYQTRNHPLGVNDAIGLRFTALDAYGNDATNREPALPIRDVLPRGYQATAQLATSDGQAAFGPTGAVATFSASRLFIGPSVELRLRTAGTQTVTITDPDDAALTLTCSYTVLGPIAYKGSLILPDPYSTGNEETGLVASTWLPADAGPYTVTDVTAPIVDSPSGPVALGSVAGVGDPVPTVIWNWNPADAPAGTVACGKDAPCSVTGPRETTFTLRDNFGNESAGSIVLTPFTTAPPPPKIFINPATNQLLLGGEFRDMQVQLSGSIEWTSADTTAIRFGADGGVVVAATPTGTNLTPGEPVKVRFIGAGEPTFGGCVPTEEGCETGAFVDVEIIYGGPDEPDPDYTTVNGARTIGFDTCGVYIVGDLTCPRISFVLPFPGPGTVGDAYSYQARGTSPDPLDAIIWSKVSGTLPPGLALNSNGLLSGEPTTAGLYTYTLFARGTHSGAYSQWVITQLIEIE